ncbi:hypothetical protein BC939DRAFT_166037 [Gamsiella multidivaricata]|uniref:uncharacterized protein n=1 Tax=Gamsiella multidivaricata TaxID=101098 RepID=UPI0022201340|nr:uncharacterized protein BC939DRAFT_166037 [Gamsiella multidivaricata]KAI7823184.1 hypothetical protein BC939DRAFT_166037 [Gamsiella multidivaricata]
MDARGQNDLSDCGSEPSSLPSKDKNGDGVLEIATSNLDKVASTTMRNGSPQKTSPAPLSSTSSASSASSPSTTTTSPGSPPESPAEDREISSQLQEPGHGADLTSSALQGNLSPPTIVRSLSHSKRQSVFLADHITVSQEGPLIDSPSTHLSGSNDDSQDMKEVEIETTDPSHLFWVPFHLHPEIAPNEYNQWLTKHGVESETADGIISSRKASVTRRKSVLSAQYNPEEDQEDRPSRPARLEEEAAGQDFLSGVFSVPLEQMGEPPLKTKTSLRRSVSLSVSSPTSKYIDLGRNGYHGEA